MGNIKDIIASTNSQIITSQKKDKMLPFGVPQGELLGYNKAGYPVYKINGQRYIPLGFYVNEQKFAEYYGTAKEIATNGMKMPTGQNERLLDKPDVNQLLHYSLDFFRNNYNLSKNMKIKDIMALGKMMIKDLPNMMR
jgi:hypothetical protein